MKILIADDSQLTRRMLAAELKRWDYEVVEAENGRQALEMLCGADAPQLAILDWLMPEMDGPDVCRNIRDAQRSRYTYMLLLTTQAGREHVIEGLNAGADDYLIKPVDPDELEQRLNAGKRIIDLQDQLLATQDSLQRTNTQLQQANEELANDLKAAASVQRSQLPSQQSKLDKVEVAWSFIPCSQVSGDFLNVFQLDETHIGIYLLDVCGHGVPAALMSVAVSRAMAPSLQDTCIVTKPVRGSRQNVESLRLIPPSEVAETLQRRFLTKDRFDQYFTMLYGILNTETGHLRVTSAGHPPAIIVRAGGRTEALEIVGGPPIGLLPADVHPGYIEESAKLESGDRLYFYSDGVIEAQNKESELFGQERLEQQLENTDWEPIDDVVVNLVEAVKRWESGAIRKDDVSILAIGLP